MINPTPVNPKSTPYQSGQGRTGLPKAINVSTQPPMRKRSRLNWKNLFVLSFILLVIGSATYVYAYFNSLKNAIIVAHEGDSSSILSYDVSGSLSNLDASQFKQAGNGRFNIVLVGIGGAGHAGGNLTDSIQVMSVDTINKKVGITSIPRDLYVNVPGYGYSKINATYNIGEERKKGGGGLLMRQVMGNVLGIKISNFVLIDFSGTKQLVDALGGIDVNVPKAIVDPLFPDEKTQGFSPFSIDAGMHHMDGATALRYSRSRETTSDYDRSGRQQLVIAAIKNKALSAGTLSNPIKVNALIKTLGQHVRTDLQTQDIERFLAYYKDIPANQTTNKVLDTSADLGLLTSSSGTAAGYISFPVKGQGNYTDVHTWFQKNNPDPLILKEATTISVAAAGGTTAKQAQAMVDMLNSYGYQASLSTTKYTGKLRQTTLFDTINNKKPFSHNYLTTLFGGTTQNDDPLSSGSDFELIYVYSASKTF